MKAKIQDAQCPTCDGCGMIPGTLPDDDVMNTPCPDCNKREQPTQNAELSDSRREKP